MDDQMRLPFPSTLEDALVKKKVSFEEKEDNYKPIDAYRMIRRKRGDLTPITIEDFWSQIECHKNGKPYPKAVDETNIYDYSCSLFKSRTKLEKAIHIDKGKKVIFGQVKDSYGPCAKKSNGHIHWWLYDRCDPSCEFEVIL